jgi:DNA-binding GntR family transcriptional regulator
MGSGVSPKLERSLPPYLQIAEHYRDMIRRGELKDGDYLPSTRQIMTEWGVAIATAHKVVTTLRAEGLVQTTPGGAGGTVVGAAHVGNTPRDRMLATKRFGKIYAPDEHARIVSAEQVSAPDYVADALNVKHGAAVIRRKRVTYKADQPVSSSTSWFDGSLAEFAPDLLKLGRITIGTPGYIARLTGRSLQLGQDNFAAAPANATIAADLGVAVGEPVLIGRNWVRDASGDVIEFGEYASLAGRWQTYEYELG